MKRVWFVKCTGDDLYACDLNVVAADVHGAAKAALAKYVRRCLDDGYDKGAVKNAEVVFAEFLYELD